MKLYWSEPPAGPVWPSAFYDKELTVPAFKVVCADKYLSGPLHRPLTLLLAIHHQPGPGVTFCVTTGRHATLAAAKRAAPDIAERHPTAKPGGKPKRARAA